MIPPELFQASYIMVLISSVSMSLSAAEVTDFNAKNMWRAAFTVLLASLTIFFPITYGAQMVSKVMPSQLALAFKWLTIATPTSLCDRAFQASDVNFANKILKYSKT